MVYILFGPPGVGKTYLGKLLNKRLGYYFFDADNLISESERELLKTGRYDQVARDRFVAKLRDKVDKIINEIKGDAVVAEAFTKEKNRKEFIYRYDSKIKFIMIVASKSLAFERVFELYPRQLHPIDEKSFKLIWREFDLPMIPHEVISNLGETDDELLNRFKYIT